MRCSLPREVSVRWGATAICGCRKWLIFSRLWQQNPLKWLLKERIGQVVPLFAMISFCWRIYARSTSDGIIRGDHRVCAKAAYFTGIPVPNSQFAWSLYQQYCDFAHSNFIWAAWLFLVFLSLPTRSPNPQWIAPNGDAVKRKLDDSGSWKITTFHASALRLKRGLLAMLASSCMFRSKLTHYMGLFPYARLYWIIFACFRSLPASPTDAFYLTNGLENRLISNQIDSHFGARWKYQFMKIFSPPENILRVYNIQFRCFPLNV